MVRPTSFRLPEELLERLEQESRTIDITTSSLVATMLDEGLKTRRFPGIVFRDGPTGRRAGLVGGPDIWEIIRDLQHTPGRGMKRVENLATEIGLPVERVALAADFYSANSEEIDRLIELDEQAAQRVRQIIDQRERLLSQ